MKFRAALAQIDSRVGDLQHNIQHHVRFVEKALREKAQLILFPELSLTGYSLRDLAWEVALNPHTHAAIRPLLRKSKSISIAVGFVERGSDHGIYNAAMFLEDGELKHIHRKIYPPTYGMFEEGRYFSAGRSVRAFDSKLGRLGILVCEDMWHISLPYLLAMDGAETILSLTASPTRASGTGEQLAVAQVNHEQHQAYARLLSSYILFANRVGFEDGVNFWGGSAATNPSGETMKVAKLFSEDLIIVEIDSGEVQRARQLSRHFLDENIDLVCKTLERISHSQNNLP